MPTYIIKIKDDKTGKDYYMEWSTVVDAPLTQGMSLEDFKAFYHEQYPNRAHELEARLERVERTGCSVIPPIDSVEDLISENRAGEKEKHLTKEEIIEKYCTNPQL